MSIVQVMAAEGELSKHILALAENKFTSKSLFNSFDLFPFFSVLVSTAINLNTDCFDSKQIWRARHTPEDKPLNILHMQDRIVGHMVENLVVDGSYQPVPDNTLESMLPSKLHIITASVLYSVWDDKDKQAEINSIIAKISKGELFVSMECLFKDFDYVLINAKGEQKLVARNEQTNYLTKYLRQYKGSGRVGEYTIARFLKDITFSAVGLVDKPANPESIISDKLNLFSNVGYINLDENTLKETNMSEKVEATVVVIEDTPQYKALSAKYEKLEQTFAAKMKEEKESDEEEKSEAKKQIALLQKQIADKDDEDADAAIKAKKDKADYDKEMAELEEKLKAATKDKEDMADKVKCIERTDLLMAADTSLTREKAAELLTKAGSMSDSTFDAFVTTITTYAAASHKETSAEKVIDSAKADADADIKFGAAKDKTEHELVRAQVSSWYKSKNTNGKSEGDK